MILITGSARSGTGYMSAMLKAGGFDVGHEKPGRDGTSDWHAVGWTWPVLVGYGLRVHVWRAPLDCFRSLVAIKHWPYIGAFIPEVLQTEDRLHRAMLYWYKWNLWAGGLWAEGLATVHCSVVDAANVMATHLGVTPEQRQAMRDVPSNVNTRVEHPEYRPVVTWADCAAINKSLSREVRALYQHLQAEGEQ